MNQDDYFEQNNVKKRLGRMKDIYVVDDYFTRLQSSEDVPQSMATVSGKPLDNGVEYSFACLESLR